MAQAEAMIQETDTSKQATQLAQSVEKRLSKLEKEIQKDADLLAQWDKE